MRTTASLWPRVRRPAGTSWLALWIAWITWSTPTPSAVTALGLIWMRISRVTRPLTSTRATPGWFSSALTIVWSVSDVSSLSSVACDSTASDTTGWLFSFSMRLTSGSLTSRGNEGRTTAILSRTSWIACAALVDRRNSTNTWLDPSREFEKVRLTPDTWLTAYSIGLVTSASTASGAAPGYAVMIITNGRLTSGICSTRNRLYENAPSTVMPIITIVAKTGLLIETRVIHMVGSWPLAGISPRTRSCRRSARLPAPTRAPKPAAF